MYVARAFAAVAGAASEAAAVDLSGIAGRAGQPVELPDLPLARTVVQATLRLDSPAFLTARLAKRPHQACGTEVPEGSTVLVPFWLLHRDPQRWHALDSFDPSRFAGGRQPGRFDYLPFGIGPHVCIGAQLAMLEATLVLARLERRILGCDWALNGKRHGIDGKENLVSG
ncbi:cytochrome P450 [Paraburkholderia sp. BL10I2N1]|uniref:cytochrome P450 n=1 Tax=Paraburkholderia sp. BL10I2N1 TaxID=1938796 RepID=UPI001FB5CEF3|nr:cytochrome P450 [Paraburkholderia sp. BL10I2N1]